MDVSDFTNFKLFRISIANSFWASVDSAAWTINNVLVVWIFILIAPLWYIFDRPFRHAREIIGYRGSDVSSVQPDYYKRYKSKLHSKWSAIVRKLSQDEKTGFDFDLAEFHVHLCSLAYEPWNTVKEVFKFWEIPVKFVRFGHEGCCVLAVWSEEHDFVVLTFKGTSPFDLTEWLTDATLRKTVAKNGVLPGLVHTGFYGSFGFPERDIIKREQIKALEEFPGSLPFRLTYNFNSHSSQIHGTYYDPETGEYSIRTTPLDEDLKKMDGTRFFRIVEKSKTQRKSHVADDGVDRTASQHEFWETIMYPNLLAIKSRFKGKQPDLWVSGHSLGAAAATVFTAMLLWRRSDHGKGSTVLNMDWDKAFKLRGTYTYGNPRVGDMQWKNSIETVWRETDGKEGLPKYQFWRIINANDVVCSIPLAMTEILFRSTSTVHRGVSLNDFQHIGNPIRLGYRNGFIDQSERGIMGIIQNQFTELQWTLPELFRGTLSQRILVLLNFCTFGIVGLIRDHFPRYARFDI
ncbi:Alpha/Beta hydrolase protein [Jimgerdemannia flammicorona]|uniref:Alpha/Beta hydrolase protein n=1 Tax=Jimgerdemannia flammicorona TaxID=994334 RepID=A0A433D3F3_9FUNG|nr:Alpha/Beta hydrolase protein [Jimgerdemannia flammicorona]